jgi:hypothetical protein
MKALTWTMTTALLCPARHPDRMTASHEGHPALPPGSSRSGVPDYWPLLGGAGGHGTRPATVVP